MAKTSNGKKQGNSAANTTIAIARNKRRTFAITQRGVRTSQDVTSFHEAALADIDSGATDLREMGRMIAIAGQILQHENMKLRAGLKLNRFLLDK